MEVDVINWVGDEGRHREEFDAACANQADKTKVVFRCIRVPDGGTVKRKQKTEVVTVDDERDTNNKNPVLNCSFNLEQTQKTDRVSHLWMGDKSKSV